jgi:hypothetical protein
MSFPSGSTIKVILQNGASPNTGPFDIWINSLTASQGGVFIANDVSKATLSGSGYEFITPVETFSVLAKSDSSCQTIDIVGIPDIPGTTNAIRVTGSYDESLTPGLVTASVFFDNGYGLERVGTIPTALNTCPSTTGIGTGSVNNNFPTLVVLKTNETSSQYIKFFANGGSTSDYFYYVPSSASVASFKAVTSVNVCADLSSGNYQTVATNSINVHPTASINTSTTKNGDNVYDLWVQLKANGAPIYSGSAAGGTSFFNSVPGGALVELTASIPQISGWTSGNVFTSSLQVQNLLRYNSPEYALDPMINLFQTTMLSNATSVNTLQYSFQAVPGGYYELFNIGNIDGVNYAYSASLCGTGATSSVILNEPLIDGNIYLRVFDGLPQFCATYTFVKFTSTPQNNQPVEYFEVPTCADPSCPV